MSILGFSSSGRLISVCCRIVPHKMLYLVVFSDISSFLRVLIRKKLSMGLPSEQPTFAYNLMQHPIRDDTSDTEHAYSAYQSQPEFLSSNLQSDGMVASSSTPTSYSQRPHQ